MTNKKKQFGMLLLVLVFGIIATGCQSTPSAVMTAQENSTIISAGTGFFITADGYVVTCAHVIEDARVIGVWVGGNRYNANLVAQDPETDVAILKIDYRPSNYFRLVNFESASIGDRVYALGFPLTDILGSDIRLTDGIISALSGFGSDRTNFQVSAPVLPGNSGGPVFNERFEVIGVAASKLISEISSNVSFAVRSTYVLSLLPRDARITGGNVRTMPEAINATVQISVDDIFDGPPITLVNHTGFNVRSVYISQTASNLWGQDRLESDQVFNNGESLSFNLPFPLNVVNRYDIQLIDVNGNAYTQMNVVVAANSRIVFGTPPISESSPGSPSPTTPSVGTTLSGVYSFSSAIYLTFNGNNYTRTMPSGTDSGTYRISGNSIIFSQSMWGSNTWAILDTNTLRDPDGDLWRRQETPAALSGTYYYSPSLYITFNGNNYTLTMPNGTDSGTYRISGNSIIFSQSMYGSNTWVVVDSNTLRDPEDDLWRRR